MTKNHLSPYDRYIRSILNYLPVAREFFEKHLPPDITKIIDFSTLTPQKDSFINDKLRLQIADLLFSVNFNGDPGYITFYLNMPPRLTGSYPTACFSTPWALWKATFFRPYQLIDLHKIPDETLQEAYYWFGAAALTAKHIRRSNLVFLVKSMIDLLVRLKKEGLDNYVYFTLSYIFTAGKVKDEEAFREIVESGLSSNDKEKIMTLAEIFHQKGKEEGKLEALHEMALNFLRLGISKEQVAQATKLSLQEVQDLW